MAVLLLLDSRLGLLSRLALSADGTKVSLAQSGSWAAPLLLGLVFGTAFTPCVGPFLGSVLAFAATSWGAGTGALLLTAYALGPGDPVRPGRTGARGLPGPVAAAQPGLPLGLVGWCVRPRGPRPGPRLGPVRRRGRRLRPAAALDGRVMRAPPVYAGEVGNEPGRLKRALQRFTADEEDVDSAELRSETSSIGATAVNLCSVGSPVCVAGTLRAVVLRPLAGVPTLEAELYDGTGTVTLVWLGRRRIRGIDPGRTLVARGRLTRRDGQATLFNPAYELRATGG